MKQSVHLGEFALAALAGEMDRGPEADLAGHVVSAIRLYLNDRSTDQPGWPYPGFLPEGGEGDGVEVELDIEERLWRAFVEEAGGQEVTVSQLASHAAFYYAAGLSSGRFTQRIADDLEGEGT